MTIMHKSAQTELIVGISNNVIPAQAGIYNPLISIDPSLGSGFLLRSIPPIHGVVRRGDEKTIFRGTLV